MISQPSQSNPPPPSRDPALELITTIMTAAADLESAANEVWKLLDEAKNQAATIAKDVVAVELPMAMKALLAQQFKQHLLAVVAGVVALTLTAGVLGYVIHSRVPDMTCGVPKSGSGILCYYWLQAPEATPGGTR